MTSAIKIDGKEYPNIHVTSLRRSFQVMDGPNAGRLMNFDMVRDVGGTFYNYSLTIDSSMANPEEYDEFYEIISSPVDSHSIEVPYAQGVLAFEAYVTNGEDVLFSSMDEQNVWNGLSVNFIAMSPKRRPE